MQRSYHSGGQRRPNNARFQNRGGSGNRGRSTKELHYSHFVNEASEAQETAVYNAKNEFKDFALSDQTKRTLEHIGYTTPSPIQDQCITPALEGKDVIGIANTGTGKTAAFLLPTIEKMLSYRAPIAALILAPTRELASQIDEEFRKFSAGQKLYSTLVVGGMNIGRQIKQVKYGPNIIIGTPGRVKDLIDRNVIILNNVTTFILDEADRMCDMGFSRDIRYIASQLPPDHQTLCFSATMTPAVKTIVEEFMTDPLTVSVVQRQTAEHINQDVIHARDKAHKVDILTEMLAKDDFERVIVFGETKFGVQRLSDSLSKSGIPSVAIHGNKSQAQRNRALDEFKTGRVSVMVATDVAARGLDIPDVSHVINFDPPKIYEDYVHRIGRTGRAGKTGIALTFITSGNK